MELLRRARPIASPSRPSRRALPAPRGGAAVRFEACASTIRRGRSARRSTASPSTSRPARRWRWSARAAPARARVFQLLLRFYDPQQGRIALDGVPIDAAVARRAARAHRPGAAGRGDLLGQRAGEHPLRPARRERRRGASPRRAPPIAHDFIDAAARGLRHLPRRARRAPVGRPAPAHRHRPRDAEERAAAAARRGHQRARRRERAAGAGGARIGDERPHHAGHRAPAGHRAARRPHRRARPGPHRRAGHARSRWSPPAGSTRGWRRCSSRPEPAPTPLLAAGYWLAAGFRGAGRRVAGAAVAGAGAGRSSSRLAAVDPPCTPSVPPVPRPPRTVCAL